MKFENVVPPEVAQRNIDKLYEMLGEKQSHDDVVWDGLSQNERLVFCRLAGCPDLTCDKTASKALADINADTRHNIIVAIQRMGSIASQFNSVTTKRETKKPRYFPANMNNNHARSHSTGEVAA